MDERSGRGGHPGGGVIQRGALVVVIGAALLPGCNGRSGGTPAGGATGAGSAIPVQRSHADAGPSPGVRRMAARLDEITRNMDPTKNRFMNRERVQILSAARGRQTDPLKRAKMAMDLALEMNRLGANEQAIAILQPLLSPPPDGGFDWPPPGHVRALIALCLYRLGMTENCMAHPNPSRCLLPVNAEGMHLEKRGGRGAMEESLTILARLPDDVASMWVLHVAAMQVGVWPDGVPERFRIPASAFASDCDIGRFPNVAIRAGLGVFGHAGGGIMEDFDGDGLLDIMVTSMGLRDQMHLYHNEGNGTFTDVTGASGLLGETGGLNRSDADYDNDGDVDVLVLRGGWAAAGGRYPNSLLRNDGHGHFEDVTDEAGILTFRPTQAGAWGDYDNDGWLDILAAGYWKPALEEDVTDVANLYLGRPNNLEISCLYHNNHDGTFTDVARRMGLDHIPLPMGTNYGDLDNDGWPDPYFGTGDPGMRTIIPNRLFRNAEGKVFQDVTTAAGMGHLQKGHGVAFGDIDNDGDQDVFEEMGGFFDGDVAQNVLYENPGHGHHWITLRLEGRRSNRSAFDVRIKVRVQTPAGPRDIHALGGTGGSFGCNSLQQEIGLGDATGIESLEVRWPSRGEIQVFRQPAMNTTYKIVEGESALTPVAVRRYRL